MLYLDLKEKHTYTAQESYVDEMVSIHATIIRADISTRSELLSNWKGNVLK